MIETKGMAHPKPGHSGKTKVVKLSPYEYAGQKRRVWHKQGQGCAHCFKGIALAEMHLHHKDGRGLGGGKRNDLKTIGLCEGCHQKEHGQ